MPRDLKQYIEHFPKTALNLGCGRNNPPDFYGLDIMELDGVDLVADVNNGIPLPDNTFNYVYARDFLEHIDAKNNIKLMEEIYRILKPGGKLEFIVPSTDGNNTAAFQDPTHFSFWNEMKFNYFLKDEHGKGFRSLYNIKCWFVPERIETYWNEWNITYVKGILVKELVL